MSFFFFFNDTATTEIYTLSLHDALRICPYRLAKTVEAGRRGRADRKSGPRRNVDPWDGRSEEHTSELQSRLHLVCRLLLEKKKENREQRYFLCLSVLCSTTVYCCCLPAS